MYAPMTSTKDAQLLSKQGVSDGVYQLQLLHRLQIPLIIRQLVQMS